MTDSTTTNVSSKTIPYQDVARDIDIDTTLGLDPWRPLQSGDINLTNWLQFQSLTAHFMSPHLVADSASRPVAANSIATTLLNSRPKNAQDLAPTRVI